VAQRGGWTRRCERGDPRSAEQTTMGLPIVAANAEQPRPFLRDCMGWTQMITCMEVYMEHGINLRDGYF
jgi:hypothetical protein